MKTTEPLQKYRIKRIGLDTSSTSVVLKTEEQAANFASVQFLTGVGETNAPYVKHWQRWVLKHFWFSENSKCDLGKQLISTAFTCLFMVGLVLKDFKVHPKYSNQESNPSTPS